MNQPVERPWGSYTVLLDEPDHKVKTITVKAGQRLSLQRHRRREEHWTIVSGEALVTNGYKHDMEYNPETFLRTYRLCSGDSITIARGAVHRIAALEEDVTFIEVQLGTYLGEDDIERLEDDYQRT